MKTSSSSTSFFLAAFVAVAPLASRDLLVAAHGYVNDITIGGRKHVGSQVRQGFRAPISSVIRQVEDTQPVLGVDNPAIVCGLNAAPASEVADAYPGDEVAFNWGSSWPHRVGPMSTYMASCGDAPCSQFDASQARWFKISELALRPGSTNQWYQSDLADGKPAIVQIPSNLAPGNYLIRHEVIALHIAMTLGGAEFYPSCSQLRVLGSGTGQPREEELIRLPGAYSQDDPGLWVKDIYEVGFQYVTPGPRVAAFVNGGPSGNGGAPSPAPAPAPEPATPSPEKPVVNIPVAPINVAPIPGVEPSSAPAPAPTSPASVPAPTPSTIRRCKNRGNAAQRAEKRRLAAEAAAAASPSAVPASSSPIVKLTPAPPAVEKRSHVVGSYARRHHDKAMRRMASAHSH